MSTVSVTRADLADADLIRPGDHDVVVGLFSGPDGVRGGRGAALAGDALGVDVVAVASTDPDFDGTRSARTVAVVTGPAGTTRLVLVGLGEHPASPATLFDAAVAANVARPSTSTLAAEANGALGAVALGHALGAWRYRREPGVPAPTVPVTLVDAGVADGTAEAVLARAAVIARVTGWVRQLVEAPPNTLRPNEFADAVSALAGELAPESVVVEAWDEATLKALGFGATLAVGAGSVHSPLVVELRLTGDGPTTALAGKGITFDSGGVNLKRDAGELSWMKSDMAAAASVAAAVIAAAALGRSASVVAILPVAENMPGGSALRPGDVVTHPGGRTTEVLDTDCEGRLVLADALGYLSGQRPERIVDVGTLFDSGALGTAYWGCWSNVAGVATDLVDAGVRAFDPGWALPLHPTYLALLSSRVADVANAPADAPDSSLVAATYLSTFVGDVPWVHVDNGSAAWLERDAYPWPAGATGTPLRALLEFLHPGP
ncbi:leucyl aminopeptidase [Mycobacterium yunnanensis]|uniref:Probable cytosol aminopeptidase n=1 Tax=Mycobacterium yunnanensis TaxID=368477 RepID=A0A9X2YWW2_9MYCO|nr:leucyl aminopeptidase [Mycobacterium yunnanensis]MCV7420160.1 leucyl aminopeptidase [Mycobacterium yunnanensis]